MVLALEIGGTHIRIAEVSGDKMKKKTIMATPRKKDDILLAISSLIQKIKPKDRKVICVSIAGYVKDGVVLKSPNIDFNGVQLEKYLHDKYNSKVYVGNDARCAALAEIKYGNGKKLDNFVFLTLGTGIGGAIVIDKKVYLGSGFAGEVGHMLLEGDEFEKVASGRALDRLAIESGLPLQGEDITKDAMQGGNLSDTIFDIIIENLSLGIMNLVHVLDPQAIIIGGGFSSVPFLPDKLSQALKEKDIITRDVKILDSKLGQDAGLIGAALLAKHPHFH